MTRMIVAAVAALAIAAPVRLNAGLTPSRDRSDRRAKVLAEPDTLRIGFLKPGGGYVVETIPIETYVARVVAGEAARGSRPAALEALAITVRTFALANRGRHRADGFDLCDQTHCQVVRAATPATERAAEATTARILVRGPDGLVPAPVYYSASCGGRTEIPSEVWPGAEDPPYLPSQPDSACLGMPAWTADLSDDDVQAALHAAGYQGRLEHMSIAARNASGRVSELRLQGLDPPAISGQDLRVAIGRTLGWQHVKSASFDVRQNGGTYHFSGRGSGHGVGLCVTGSAHLADTGWTAETILARYFPGLSVSQLAMATSAAAAPPAPVPVPVPSKAPARAAAPAAARRALPAVVVALPEGDQGQQDGVERMALRARDELAARLGVPAPATITVRVHPTTDDYERATGQAWFTSGAIVNGEVHLLPLAVLRERGTLDLTIRHALTHLLTADALRNRPLWVQEGAALYFAGGQPAIGSVRQWPPYRPQPTHGCPTDAELGRPVSVGALANAYARARACFAKQLEAGKGWKDVR